MLPLFDEITKKWFMPFTWLLIALNTLVSLFALYSPQLSEEWLMKNILKPTDLYNIFDFIRKALISMHLHSDLYHLIFNMIFLFAFALSIEHIVGHIRFIVLYYLAGIFGLWFYCLSGSTLPIVGASSAVAGLMAAYLIMFPGARIFSVMLVLWVIRFLYVPAWIYLIYWIAIQILGWLLITNSEIAYSAHIGGIMVGIIFGIFYKYAFRNQILKAVIIK